MTTRQDIERAITAAVSAATGNTQPLEPSRLLEFYGITDDSALEVEHYLENELQFGFRDDLTLRPDMTVEQALSVVERCLREDGGTVE